jgi:hypothetical protein
MRKYQGESLPENKTELTKVSKIHFLIHPGFMLREANSVDDATLPALNKLNEENLFLTKVKPDELVIAITHAEKGEIKESLHEGNKFYLINLKRWKKQLGRRLIVLSNNFQENVLVYPNLVETLKRLVNARGFDFDSNVVTDAVGELEGVCLPTIAGNLNTALDLTNPTQITIRDERIKAIWKDDPNISFT